MQETKVEYAGLNRLSDDFYEMAKRFPEERRHIMAQLARTMQGVVGGAVGGTGKVRSWQNKYTGSGGGWAAVRPKGKTTSKGYAVGYITNAIENGHKVRGPSGHARRYQPRLKKTRVPGKGFYARAEMQVENIALRAAENLMDRLTAELGG